jgi:uncharacterized protein YdaU (DUF1376 family)
MNIGDHSAKSRAKRHMPWYKRCPVDWRAGTRSCSMTMELRGFYSECLDAMWELQGPLPKDAKALAMLLGSNPRQVRALMAKLVDLGKMVETDNDFRNTRMLADIFQGQENVESTSNGAPIERQSTSKVRKKSANSTRDLEEETEAEKKEPPLPPKGASPGDALKAFHAYNETALRCGLQQAAKLTPDRQRKIIARLKDYGLDGWTQALANIERSSFLTGKNDRGWRASLDFLVQAESFGKVHDGGYGNGRHTAAATVIQFAPKDPNRFEDEAYLLKIAKELGVSVNG